MRSVRRAVIACVCAGLAAAVPVAPAASAAPAPTEPTTQPMTDTVRLITGDQVTITAGETGEASLSVRPAPRPGAPMPRFESYTVGDATYVVPEDAAPFVKAGQLDRTLFDVTYLMRAHLGAAIPVITEFAGTQATAAAAGTLAGATLTRELESIHGAALSVPIGQTSAFWQSLSAKGQRALGARVGKVWLDRPVHATLDRSVPKVGAPQAWQAGFDGTGVQIAVLDTGIDLTHPDFAGRIADTRDFTGKGTVQDGHFHGTHVASIAAGRGTASGGRYTGVAPGARLVIGKVLDDTGSGAISQIIDGMEWAVSTGARVVNLSLGADAGTEDGGDPMVDALDTLSTSTGALFVVAAGNKGPAASTVGTPGIARSALTVSAVDTSDAQAAFSSRGPLPYSRVLKPDLAAPGVSIGAARAAGTSYPGATPIDDFYTRASGTSMATPHVTGAAAIMAQQHPDWTGARIKAALMSSSADLGFSSFLQGAGRLDVGKAITRQVVSMSTVDFGRAALSENAPVTRTTTYTNDGATPVTLNLNPDLRRDGGATVPDGTVTTPASVTVPANGNADVTVTLTPAALAVGTYSGTLAATDPSTGEVVRTPMGFVRDQLVSVRVDVLGRKGEPCGESFQDCSLSYLEAYNLDDPANSVNVQPQQPGGATLRLLPGRYRIFTSVSWRDDVLRAQGAILVEPEVVVKGASTVTLDARAARPVRIATSRPSEPYEGTMALQRPYPPPDQRPPGAIYLPLAAWVGDYGTVSFWATPTKATTAGGFLLTNQQDLGAPLLEVKVDGKGPDLHPSYFNYPWVADPAQDPRFTGRFTAPVVDVGSTLDDPELPKVKGALVLLSRTEWFQTCDASEEELTAAAKAGARGILLYAVADLCPYFPLSASSMPGAVPIASLPFAEGQALRDLAARKPVRLTVSGNPISSYLYNLKFYERTAIPANLSYRAADRDLARVQTRYHADKPNTPVRRHMAVFFGPDEPSSIVADVSQLAPLRREELMGPVQPGQSWRRAVGFWDAGEYTEHSTTRLHGGDVTDQDWLSAPRIPGPVPVQPTQTNSCTVCRQGDTLYVAPHFAGPDQNTSTFDWALPATTRLFAGDTEIPVVYYKGGWPSFALPATKTRLRLSHDWTSTDDHRAYGTRVQATWQFDSQRVTSANTAGTVCLATGFDGDQTPCSVQPLTFLRYDANVDDLNRVSHNPTILTITAYHQPSTDQPGRLRQLTVQASFDEGATWQPATAVWGWDTARRYALLPTAPRGAGSISLRVAATDSTGSTITQEVTRAYGVGW